MSTAKKSLPLLRILENGNLTPSLITIISHLKSYLVNESWQTREIDKDALLTLQTELPRTSFV